MRLHDAAIASTVCSCALYLLELMPGPLQVLETRQLRHSTLQAFA
jgi:hypothetical protein